MSIFCSHKMIIFYLYVAIISCYLNTSNIRAAPELKQAGSFLKISVGSYGEETLILEAEFSKVNPNIEISLLLFCSEKDKKLDVSTISEDKVFLIRMPDDSQFEFRDTNVVMQILLENKDLASVRILSKKDERVMNGKELCEKGVLTHLGFYPEGSINFIKADSKAGPTYFVYPSETVPLEDSDFIEGDGSSPTSLKYPSDLFK